MLKCYSKSTQLKYSLLYGQGFGFSTGSTLDDLPVIYAAETLVDTPELTPVNNILGFDPTTLRPVESVLLAIL